MELFQQQRLQSSAVGTPGVDTSAGMSYRVAAKSMDQIIANQHALSNTTANAIFSGLSGLGRALGSALDKRNAAKARQDKLLFDTQVERHIFDAAQQLHSGLNTVQANNKDNPQSWNQQGKDIFDSVISGLDKSIQDPAMRLTVQKRMYSLGRDELDSLDTKAASQLTENERQYFVNDLTATENRATEAGLKGDFTGLKQITDVLEASDLAKRAANLYGPKGLQMIQDSQGKLEENFAIGATSGNPELIIDMMRAGAMPSIHDPKTRESIVSRAQGFIDRREAQRLADFKTKIEGEKNTHAVQVMGVSLGAASGGNRDSEAAQNLAIDTLLNMQVPLAQRHRDIADALRKDPSNQYLVLEQDKLTNMLGKIGSEIKSAESRKDTIIRKRQAEAARAQASAARQQAHAQAEHNRQEAQARRDEAEARRKEREEAAKLIHDNLPESAGVLSRLDHALITKEKNGKTRVLNKDEAQKQIDAEFNRATQLWQAGKMNDEAYKHARMSAEKQQIILNRAGGLSKFQEMQQKAYQSFDNVVKLGATLFKDSNSQANFNINVRTEKQALEDELKSAGMSDELIQSKQDWIIKKAKDRVLTRGDKAE